MKRIEGGNRAMISNQILQSTIDGLKQITKRDFCILDTEAKIVVTTDGCGMGEFVPQVEDFLHSQADSQEMMGAHYFKIYDDYLVEYVLSVAGTDEEAYKLGKLAMFQIQGLLTAYKERFDKENFVKNLLLDNLLLIDIYTRAKKLHIKNNVSRVVYLINCGERKNTTDADTLRVLFPDKSKDFITAVDEKNIILVKEVMTGSEDEVESYVNMIYKALSHNEEKEVYVAVGTPVNDLKDVSKSYKEAAMAFEVGRIFNEDTHISYYSKLGIGRIIYQLPLSLCRLFIKEVLKDKKLENFDEETIATIHKFFDNSLNVSETSRQLYIHRNTLVYRLDKLQKMTGLDLRQFDDAIIFKITIMVSQYMDYMEKQG